MAPKNEAPAQVAKDIKDVKSLNTETSQTKDLKDNKNLNEHQANLAQQAEYLLKPCQFYKEEYSDCRSLKAWFQQYYVYGARRDCSNWHTDYLNCQKWKKEKDFESLEKLIKSENERRLERWKYHLANDVWEKREHPPEDWAKQLPEWVEKASEDGPFSLVKGLVYTDIGVHADRETFCVIL